MGRRDWLIFGGDAGTLVVSLRQRRVVPRRRQARDFQRRRRRGRRRRRWLRIYGAVRLRFPDSLLRSLVNGRRRRRTLGRGRRRRLAVAVPLLPLCAAAAILRRETLRLAAAVEIPSRGGITGRIPGGREIPG